MARPQNQSAHGEHSIARLAAGYAVGISRNHPFLDGNKRTSLVVAELFLEINGVELIVTDAACVTTFLQLAAGELDLAGAGEALAPGVRPQLFAHRMDQLQPG